MASLYRRKNSPYAWIKFKNDRGEIQQKSTGCRWDDELEMRKARAARAELEAVEIRHEVSNRDDTRLSRWVEAWLGARYSESPKTLKRYRSQWRTLEAFLATYYSQPIIFPREIKRQMAYDYFEWRRTGGHGNRRHGRYVLKKKIGIHHNTALAELKTLGLIIQECVHRRWLDYNPIRGLGIKKIAPKEKPEMTDEHVRILRLEIQNEPEPRRHFLHASLEIALHQACRMFETRFPLADVDFANQRLRLTVKGRDVHYAALNPNLVPLLQQWKAEGREWTWNETTIGGSGFRPPQLVWSQFFKKLNLRHQGLFDGVSFHCTRVRGISLLERAGVPEHLVMSQVRHSSTTVHRVYRRVKAAELAPFWSALQTDTRETPESPGEPPTT